MEIDTITIIEDICNKFHRELNKVINSKILRHNTVSVTLVHPSSLILTQKNLNFIIII